MGLKKIEHDLRDAGLRKKRARKVAKAADRGRSGDRASRKLVEQHAAALRDSISAVVSHAKPPTSKSSRTTSANKSAAKKPTTMKRPAKKATSKKGPAKKATARKRPARKATANKRPAQRTSKRRASAQRSSSKSSRPKRGSK